MLNEIFKSTFIYILVITLDNKLDLIMNFKVCDMFNAEILNSFSLVK